MNSPIFAGLVLMSMAACTFFGCLKIEEIAVNLTCKQSIYMNREITLEERSFCNKLAEARTFGFKKPFSANGKLYAWDKEKEVYLEERE